MDPDADALPGWLNCVAHPGRSGVAFVSYLDRGAVTWRLYCATDIERFRRLDDPATRIVHIAGVVTTSKGDQP